tara:strand:- start:506 stop:796 length:291 start_codon:yes stop_codon:yes gene_type:complete
MTITYTEDRISSITKGLLKHKWETHHVDQVEFWLMQYYFNDEEYRSQDNLRIARGWIPSEVKEYDKKYKTGSRNSIDMGLSTMEGVTIRVGFNHDQ